MDFNSFAVCSSSAFDSGIDDIGVLLKLLNFQRDRGDIKFDFLYGDDDDGCACWKTRRFVNDFGDELRSSIFIAVAFMDSCFNFNCSTADGFTFKGFRLVAFNKSFLKSFNDVFGVPNRSLHVVCCGSIDLLLTCDIAVLFPKLNSLSTFNDEDSLSLWFFNGVDVLNVDLIFGGDFFAFD